MLPLAKQAAALLPERWQQALKRTHFRRQIAHASFRTNEPEWDAAAQWLVPGDWAIDVGANVGHYTKRFSELVGPGGRVIAFEPVPATFELLAANVAQFAHPNVTLLNLAASDSSRLMGMSIPSFDSGLRNYYQAALTGAPCELQVMTCPIDALALNGRVRMLKVDAEGHDAVVLHGAIALLRLHRPVVVIESSSTEVVELMEGLGYSGTVLPDSSNVVYRHEAMSKRGA
jgi:FkbM family methyltransferase